MLVIVRPLRWYHRVWHAINTVFGGESVAYGVLPPDDDHPWLIQLDEHFLCPRCWEYQTLDSKRFTRGGEVGCTYCIDFKEQSCP